MLATEYNWYKAHQNYLPSPKLPDVKIIGKHWGFQGNPSYELVERYDLRYFFTGTTDELFDRYF